MTQTSDQGQRLLDEAQRRGLVLMVDHTFVYTGAIQKIRELVRSGSVGDIYYFDSVRINLPRRFSSFREMCPLPPSFHPRNLAVRMG